jgi:GNAT superfamily N-acetyltransferase
VAAAAVRVVPATPARWADLAALFGPRGACAGCWCQWPRLPSRAFVAGRGAGNRRALRGQVRAGPPPGLLAYLGRRPVGWCALAPRATYARLERSRVLAPVDDRPVWSVVCMFVAREARGRGVTVALLRAARAYAFRQGARILEGYPIDPRGGRTADTFAWWGLAPAFQRAGFREVARRSASRPIMRARLRAAARAPRG